MDNPKLLIADDSPQVTAVLAQYAEREGYEPLVASNGKEALKIFRENDPDIILLDIMMPDINGFDVCKIIRRSSNVPIIFISARGEDYDRIMGFDLGADNYLVKPFSPGLVMAAVRAVMRRCPPGRKKAVTDPEKFFSYDNLSINLEEYSVRIGSEDVHLTRKEIEILWTLATNENKVFSREDLLDAHWDADYYGESRTVDSHMKRLRGNLNTQPHPNWDIRTIWGLGYKFETRSSDL